MGGLRLLSARAFHLCSLMKARLPRCPQRTVLVGNDCGQEWDGVGQSGTEWDGVGRSGNKTPSTWQTEWPSQPPDSQASPYFALDFLFLQNSERLQ